jgi:hypothetical protein
MIKRIGGEFAEWIATVGPILAAIGFMKVEKGTDGKEKYVPHEHAIKALHILPFGMGVDDEVAQVILIGRTPNDGGPKTKPVDALKKISAWLGKLESFQKDRFRLIIATAINNLCSGKDAAGTTEGTKTITNFFGFLADMKPAARKKFCITNNFFSENPPLAEQANKKIKKEIRGGGGKKVTEAIASGLDRINKNFGF